MLLWFVIAYWIISIAIGLYAATRVHNTKDFAIAGRQLPFYMVTATVFATWFGSETVLGIPATFLKEGLHGVVADPFGAAMCLILVGVFFAAPLYRMNLLTIGDFYKKKFGRSVETLTTIAIVISYLGWVGAQITALGLVFNVVSAGEISKLTGMWIGSSTILVYTFFGGMWAVAVTDFLQMIIIVIGMLFIGHEISGQVGGVGVVVNHALQAGKFEFWPTLDAKEIIGFTAAWITMMFGSIPQQDVFQRVQSAKTVKIAIWGSILGGGLYFLFAFVPMFLAYSATLIDPALVAGLIDSDPQMILPNLVMQHAPLFAQVMFFGALLSAIKSCASATLLAPSVTFTENILKPMIGHRLTDHELLRAMRGVTLVFTVLVTLYAINSKASIFKMVENAYQITLVMAFVPLVAGVYWKRATTQGALAAIFCGLVATPFYPRSPYAVAKLYAHWITINYRESYGIFACSGILFNHESPIRGETFVTRKITRALARIALGLQDCLYLGNLGSKRDWGHARDYVEAQWLMLQQDQPDDYVIATGKQYSVREFVGAAAREIGIEVKWEGSGVNEVGIIASVAPSSSLKPGTTIIRVDPKYFRPAEVETLLGDPTKAKTKLGWTAKTDFATLVKEMMQADMETAKRDDLVSRHGFATPERHD